MTTIFFCPFSSLFHPFRRHCFPRRKQFFFCPKTILTVFFSSQIVSRNVFTENFGSGGKKVRVCYSVSNHGPFSIVRTREEVDMQWARASVSTGLPMSFFDNKEVRKAVLMTAECGQSYIRSQDQTWWCQGTHTVTPYVFHYQTYPKTRQVD